MTYGAGIFQLLALLCTLGIEGAGMALWARLAYHRPWRATACALGANLIVHTLFWSLQPLFARPWPWGLCIAEAIVVLLEGAIYARCLALSGYTPWLLSCLLNLASFVAGAWLWGLLL
jgi:hypothetical protein